MSTEETKCFSAVTYEGNIYNFVITNKGDIFCLEFDLAISTQLIELKPNFILRNEEGRSFYSLDDYVRERKLKKSLISEWIIDEEVFEYLINNRRIMYSTQMAVLYGFDPKYAFDVKYQKRAFKYSRNNPAKRTKVLKPMKSGIFN